MPYEEVIEPLAWPEAFTRFDDVAVQSQAGVLASLIAQLLEVDASQVTLNQARDIVAARLEEDYGSLAVPWLAGEEDRDLARAAGQIRNLPPELFAGSAEAHREVLPVLASRVFEDPSTWSASVLLFACLFHPDPLVRVVAASGPYFIYAPLPIGRQDIVELLAREAGSREDPDVSAIAALSLSRLEPNASVLVTLQRQPGGAASEPPSTSVLLHGTWARQQQWWQPASTFHRYIRTHRYSDLYGAADAPSWSGGYSDAARALGALDLLSWTADHGIDALSCLLAHSHGGSVGMLASRGGLQLDQLVLLSCPVHEDKYWPDFARVRDVASVRVRHDIVIMLDGGGQRFHAPNIRETVLPVWFRHSATHDEAVWAKFDVASYV